MAVQATITNISRDRFRLRVTGLDGKYNHPRGRYAQVRWYYRNSPDVNNSQYFWYQDFPEDQNLYYTIANGVTSWTFNLATNGSWGAPGIAMSAYVYLTYYTGSTQNPANAKETTVRYVATSINVATDAVITQARWVDGATNPYIIVRSEGDDASPIWLYHGRSGDFKDWLNPNENYEPYWGWSQAVVRFGEHGFTSYDADYTVSFYQGAALIGTRVIHVPPAPRPDLWYWGTLIKGTPFNMPAARWNEFLNHINGVRVWKGTSNYSFAGAWAASGTRPLASQYNIAARAINDLSDKYGASKGEWVGAVNSGSVITTDQFFNLQRAINQH